MMETAATGPGRRRGVLLGGSGLVGGAITYYFKTHQEEGVELFAPNSKKVSIRVQEDLRQYFTHYRPDFIINAAIAAIGSDPQLAFEINYLGAINLARVALTFGIPYIHISTAAVMPPGENLQEDDVLPLAPELGNYAKSKLMAELTLKYMHEHFGLDCTVIRLGIVYGKHDHKIQGFQRLLFAIAGQSMPFLMTKKGVRHSYTHAKKIPPFIDHILARRPEFSGKIFNFADPNPVDLGEITLAIRDYLGLPQPRAIHVPLPLARMGKRALVGLVRVLSRLGPEARMPAEMMFLENFYQNQTMDTGRLARSSFGDRRREASVFSKLPDLIEYYLTRWEHLNLIPYYNRVRFDPKRRVEVFLTRPAEMLAEIDSASGRPSADLNDLFW